jgi:hypothetical protein
LLEKEISFSKKHQIVQCILLDGSEKLRPRFTNILSSFSASGSMVASVEGLGRLPIAADICTRLVAQALLREEPRTSKRDKKSYDSKSF